MYCIVSLYDLTGQNPGREYFTCSRPSNEKCNFFEWIDESPQRKMFSQKRSNSNTNQLNSTNKKHCSDDRFENRRFKGHSKPKKNSTTNTSVFSLVQVSSFLHSKKDSICWFVNKLNDCWTDDLDSMWRVIPTKGLEQLPNELAAFAKCLVPRLKPFSFSLSECGICYVCRYQNYYVQVTQDWHVRNESNKRSKRSLITQY